MLLTLGNVIDPVTGKRVIKDIFADEQQLRKQLVEEIVDKPTDQVHFFSLYLPSPLGSLAF